MILPPGETFDYTFAETIDVSDAGTYEVLTIVKTINDEYILNDTLLHCFTKYGQNDVGVVNLITNDFVCSDETVVRFDIRNYSEVPLTSTEIKVMLNGIVVETIQWSGNLGFEETANFIVLIDNLIDGSNDVEVATSSPNGNMDETISNDTAIISFEANTDALEFFLELQLDFYPGETSWNLVNESNVEIASGGNYGITELIVESLCIDPEQCYTFTIFDSFGDGLIGNGPNSEGYYRIIDNNGLTVASIINLDFGDEESNSFCGTFECNLSASIDILPESVQGVQDGIITISPLNGLAPFQYSIDGGLTTSGNAMFTNLSEGDYDIWIMDSNECLYEITVELQACDIDFTVVTNDASDSNSLDGSIEISISGGTAPFEYSIDAAFSFQSSNIFQGLPTGEYDVVIRDVEGCTRQEIVSLGSLVSTSNTFIGDRINIYPNPTNGLFHLEVKTSSISKSSLQYEILDATGKLILNSKIGRFNDFYLGQISILTKPSGIYYVRFKDSELDQLIKLIKR